jgi:hypothetical protein
MKNFACKHQQRQSIPNNQRQRSKPQASKKSRMLLVWNDTWGVYLPIKTVPLDRSLEDEAVHCMGQWPGTRRQCNTEQVLLREMIMLQPRSRKMRMSVAAKTDRYFTSQLSLRSVNDKGRTQITLLNVCLQHYVMFCDIEPQ